MEKNILAQDRTQWQHNNSIPLINSRKHNENPVATLHKHNDNPLANLFKHNNGIPVKFYVNSVTTIQWQPYVNTPTFHW